MSEIAIIIIVIWVVYSVYKYWENSQPEKQIEKFEKQAERWEESACRNPLGSIGLGKAEFKFYLEATKQDYLHLKERFAHDEKKCAAFASDWNEYAYAINELSSAMDLLTVNLNDDAPDEYGKEVREPDVKRYEIEKRFQEALGNSFVDRREQWNKGRA